MTFQFFVVYHFKPETPKGSEIWSVQHQQFIYSLTHWCFLFMRSCFSQTFWCLLYFYTPLKTNIEAPKKWRFSSRNLQTSRGPPFSGLPTQGLDPPLGRHVLHGGANEIVAMVGWATWQQFPKGSQIRIEGIWSPPEWWIFRANLPWIEGIFTHFSCGIFMDRLIHHKFLHLLFRVPMMECDGLEFCVIFMGCNTPANSVHRWHSVMNT